MNIALWILQALVALFFCFGGAVKIFQPIDRLAQRFTWMGKVRPQFVRFIGVCELAGAIGLIAPEATSIAPKLTLAASGGISALMACAVIFHVMRREISESGRTLLILLIVLFITIGRWILAPI